MIDVAPAAYVFQKARIKDLLEKSEWGGGAELKAERPDPAPQAKSPRPKKKLSGVRKKKKVKTKTENSSREAGQGYRMGREFKVGTER